MSLGSSCKTCSACSVHSVSDRTCLYQWDELPKQITCREYHYDGKPSWCPVQGVQR